MNNDEKMERLIGTVVYGVRGPIINKGDDIARVASDALLACEAANIFTIEDRDIFTLTESVVARAQGNYIDVTDITEDVQRKFNSQTDHIGVVFPIMSRNRFSMILEGIAKAAKKVTIQLSYPSDEVGNPIITPEQLAEKNVNPYTDSFTYQEWVDIFGHNAHSFTGMDYLRYYQEIVEGAGAEVQIILSNDVTRIVQETKHIILSDIHTCHLNYQRLMKMYDDLTLLTLADFLNEPSTESGYNEEYGLLGSNKASETSLKLFPRDSQAIVEEIQEHIYKATGRQVEVMVYGDGAFKDPVGKIWELADPVVSPGYTSGLAGRPNELKLKFLVDSEYSHMTKEEQQEAVRKAIAAKDADSASQMVSEGTTPRQITDLIGSLSDLVSGSGDKGTPFVYIKGYFDNYTS